MRGTRLPEWINKSNLPILTLMIISLCIGVFTFRDYGLSWDEVFFYKYADAIRYAYSITDHLNGTFNLDKAYAASPEDHKYYGPAYLLIAQPITNILELIPGIEVDAAWHLVNFITFQLGVLLLYCLSTRWVDRWAAFWAVLLFATQPLLWGHAFINSKDIPFMVFFIAAIYSGFKLVDSLKGDPAVQVKGKKVQLSISTLVIAAVLLGLLTSIRVLGPLAGGLVCLYALLKHRQRAILPMLFYGSIAVGVCYFTWPYLWGSPISRFIEAWKFMAHFPQDHPLLFNGRVVSSFRLSHFYLPTLLILNLTLPIWPLFVLGVSISGWKVYKHSIDWKSLQGILLWSVIPVGYVLLKRPPLYDGFRQLIFFLPPVFVFIGIGIQAGIDRLHHHWVTLLLLIALVSPGLIGLVGLHPYQYTYYNELIGGVGGAFRKFETDYWLTCYKDTLEYVNKNFLGNTKLFVLRNPTLAKWYASDRIAVEQYQRSPDNTLPGSLLLLTSRTNVDMMYHAEAPIIYQTGRAGAVFCVLKQIK